MSAAPRPHAGAIDAPVFGWDVGGAHVKVAMADADGVLYDVAQWACPLWQGLDHLQRTIGLVFERWPLASAATARHAVTMTGEMVDLFADRAEGVRAIAAVLAQRLGPLLRFHAGDVGGAGDVGEVAWIAAGACAARWRDIASANWLATARWIATAMPDAVLVDIGSTTTDIIPIAGGRVVVAATTDAGRLASGELVYQGVVRTPLCGVAHRIAFGGATVNVMNEWFATTADVYRLTGELSTLHDQHPSADQGPKTEAASRVRIARMIGRDAHEASVEEWRRFALQWRSIQLREIGANLARVLAAHPDLAEAPLVGAGCGRFLVAELAAGLGHGRACELANNNVHVWADGHAHDEQADKLAHEQADKHTHEQTDKHARDEQADKHARDEQADKHAHDEQARRYVDFGTLAGVAPSCAEWAAICAPSVAVALLAARDRQYHGDVFDAGAQAA